MAAAVLVPIDGADWDPQRTARAITAGDHRAGGRRRPVRPAAVRQRVGRLRRVPGRRPRRPRARAADRQRDQGHRGRRRRRAVVRRDTDAGHGAYELPLPAAVGRQGGHQPAPLPDDEGTPGLQEGDDHAGSTSTSRPGGQRMVRLRRPPERRVRHDDPRPRRRRRPGRRRPARPSSVCCRDGAATAVCASVVRAHDRSRCGDRITVRATSVLVVVEHDRGELAASLEALTAARCRSAAAHALTIGADADAPADDARPLTARRPCTRRTTSCSPTTARRRGVPSSPTPSTASRPTSCWRPGTDRGHEVLAQAAARLDLPMVANCTAISRRPMTVTRVRWGGSLLEEAALDGPVAPAHHRRSTPSTATPADEPPPRRRPSSCCRELDPALARSVVVDRVERDGGDHARHRPGRRRRRPRRRLGRGVRRRSRSSPACSAASSAAPAP